MNYNDFNNIPGCQFIPIGPNKAPTVSNWQTAITKYDLSTSFGIGLVCGESSGNLEALDFDLKYDLTGSLMSEYISEVNKIDPNLIPKLFVQKTTSGGFHIAYRIPEKPPGNHAIARRPKTHEEIETEYQKKVEDAYKNHPVGSSTFNNIIRSAENARKNVSPKVLIETRGDRGQIACWPTPGYASIQKHYSEIPTITMEEREILHTVAYTFNEYEEVVYQHPGEVRTKKEHKGQTPSEDYDERGDVVMLLQSHGWTAVGRKGSKVLMRRPGDTTAKSSGNFNEETRRFSVFSTSTIFESQKMYKPYAVFAMLECGGDFSSVPKKLSELGYGTPIEKIKQHKDYVPSKIDMTDDDDFSFLANDKDYDDYIHKWRTGTFEMGLSTGMPNYDRHFRFKPGNLVVVNGVDNVGKSLIIWYKLFLSALLHNWEGIIFSSENNVGAIKKKMLEFYHCKEIGKLTELEYQEANKFFNKHFRVIKNGDDLYNYQDILNMTEKVKRKYKVDFLMLDPYNSLRVEDKISYDFHYSAVSKIQLFGKQHGISIYINTHVGTGTAKRKDEKGYTQPPNKEDSEMGVMFANKADEFLTIHRLVNHEEDFLFTEIHVHKVKETETGGRVTPMYKPVYLKSLPNQVGFINVTEKSSGSVGVNPVLTYKEAKQGHPNNYIPVLEELPPVVQGGEEEDPF